MKITLVSDPCYGCLTNDGMCGIKRISEKIDSNLTTTCPCSKCLVKSVCEEACVKLKTFQMKLSMMKEGKSPHEGFYI